MALGGGVWVTQNKILPGSYINVVSADSGNVALGERGYAAIALPLGSNESETAGTVVRIESRDFYGRPKEILPNAPEATMRALREMFKNATTVYVYDSFVGTVPATKAKVTITLDGTNPTTGIVITGGTTTVSQLGDLTAGTATLENTFTLTLNGAAKDWTTDAEDVVAAGATIVLDAKTAGPLVAGVKSALDGIGGTSNLVVTDGKASTQKEAPDVGTICTALENYYFNVLAAYTDDQEDIEAYIGNVKTWRDQVGKKVQVVVYNADTAPDSEAVINVVSTVSDEGVEPHALVAWVAGAEAGCAVNASCTNKLYNGELTIVCEDTQIELEDRIMDSEFVFHVVYDEVRVLEDINSLKSFTVDKNEDFKSNQTIRVIDQIANDIAKLFNTKYLGVIPNDQAGRISLWADIVKHHQELETMRAIENFDSSLVTVEPGNTKKAVVVHDAVIPVNAMAQLYMTVVIS